MAGIYQSRVFKFINGQTNRFKNSLGQSWRQVKVSVQWTGQILLTPLRWLNWLIPAPESQIPGQNSAQLSLGESVAISDSPSATSAIGHQPHSAMTAAHANQAIESLLATVVAAGHGLLLSSPVATHDDWSVIDENEWETTYLDESHRSLTGVAAALPPPRPVIQGLATLLSNQHLVLIDQHNQVLDILSPSQQLHIHQQIKPAMQQALGAAAALLTMPHPAALQPAQPLVVVPVAIQTRTTWQKIAYWGKFYLEYFRVDEDADQQIAPSPPSVLSGSLHKSWAITPTAITSIDPNTTNSSPLATTPSSSSQNNDHLAVNSSIAWENGSAIDIKTAPAQSQVNFQPEWIEAPSEPLGYERSLFRQLWTWLDRLMLKIENWVINIYQKLTRVR
jgi:hypothetical protein